MLRINFSQWKNHLFKFPTIMMERKNWSNKSDILRWDSIPAQSSFLGNKNSAHTLRNMIPSKQGCWKTTAISNMVYLGYFSIIFLCNFLSDISKVMAERNWSGIFEFSNQCLVRNLISLQGIWFFKLNVIFLDFLFKALN